MTERLLIAFAVVLVDAAVFVLPLAGCFLAYVIVARPPWFREWLAEHYERP